MKTILSKSPLSEIYSGKAIPTAAQVKFNTKTS
jgi:hypothetical protein